MLETGLHQGASLHRSSAPNALRWLAVAHTDDGRNQQALWAMCAHWQQLGYPVVVLDGGERESTSQPGLQDLLRPSTGLEHIALPCHERPAARIDTLPAARGMVQLVHKARLQGLAPLDLLHRLCRNHAIVVLYAPAELLAPLLRGQNAAPLLWLPSEGGHVLRSYRQFKKMLMDTGLACRLVSLQSGPDPRLQAMASCARHHLRVTPSSHLLDPTQPRQLQRFALQCLEQAGSLQPLPSVPAGPAPTGAAAYFAWSH